MRLLPKDSSLGWTRYVWLVYCLPLFVDPAISGEARDWLLSAAVLAVFLPLYFWGFWRQGRRVLPVMAAILLLGCLYAPINAAGAVFFIYAAGFLGQVGRPAVGLRYLAVILLILGLEAWLVGIPRYAWVWSMRERIEALGGAVARDGSRGTRVIVRLPVRSQTARPEAAAR